MLTAPTNDRAHPNWGMLGRFHVLDRLEDLLGKLFEHPGPRGGSDITTAAHTLPLAVLDQQDLLKQGIDPATFIPGAQEGTNELGSCTANAAMAFLSWLLPEAQFASAIASLGGITPTSPYSDPVAAERAAIGFYHGETQVMAQAVSQAVAWPPTDGGCSGLYIFDFAEAQGYAATESVAQGPVNVASMMQQGPVLQGTPWFNAWFEPDSSGFIDGDGSMAACQRAVASGLAGGHETCSYAIEKVAFDGGGDLDPYNTIFRARNSWSTSWGDQGDFLFHLSTMTTLLGSRCDFRQLAKATTP